MNNPNQYDYMQLCYNACVSVEQHHAEANEDGNTDVGVSDARQWLTLVWHEWRKQQFRDRLEKATGRAWTAPARIDALVEIKAEKGGHNE